MQIKTTKPLYDINHLPNSRGILFFPISMARISNAQSADSYIDWLLHFYPKITPGFEGVGVTFLYGDYLYMHTATDSAAVLRSKFLDQITQHRRSFITSLKKTYLIPQAFDFATWGSLLVDSYAVYQDYRRRLQKIIQQDQSWDTYMLLDSGGRALSEQQKEFILEESLIFYLVSKGEIRLPSRFVGGHESWILQAYPGKPLFTEVYLHKTNPFELDNPTNRYQNSFYDLEQKKLYSYDQISLA